MDGWMHVRVDGCVCGSETCSVDIPDDVQAILANGSCQWDGDAAPTALWVEHGEHQALQVRHGFAAQLHKGPLLLVIGPVATGHLADDHTHRRRRGRGTAVLPQWGGRRHLRAS